MGIPKAFRWLSERYPLISQLIQENRIPEFDNLYLDMNGIIHNCSHNNNEDVHFRISEEQIFLQVFAYIEHLFSKIKPKKLFFMAIDGVAPRAKMNQQRSRRFRAAKETNDRILEAKRKGEDVPEDIDDAFQSNMITPGTPFMARLTAQLKYFINKKISEDADWRGVQVVLSGHEVPGEGEHKIMEYIRLAKAQPEYNPNTRHCLYGLDADLIMLGLLSHDPHFCLLREEVLFGPAREKAKNKGLEATNFYLMHLSLLREYLDIEFNDLKKVMPASNPYDLEHIIDDFILLAIFIGNDFLPHLPGLHINEGAFNLLFGIYKDIIPRAGGYLNEHGHLNTKRLQMVLDKLSDFEKEKFEEEAADSEWIGMKNAGREAQKNIQKSQKRNAITKGQRTMLAAIRTFIFSNLDAPSLSAKLEFPASNNQQDREFLQKLTEDLKLDIAFDEFDDNDEPVIVIRLSEDVVEMLMENNEEANSDDASPVLVDEADEEDEGNDEEWEDVDEEDGTSAAADEVDETAKAVKKVNLNGNNDNLGNRHESEEVAEWRSAIERVLAKYEKAPNAREAVKSQAEYNRDYEAMLDRKVFEWKKDYYNEKLEFDIEKSPESLKLMAFKYIEGLQWVLHYYYDGVASWSWFYPYHYSPKISDLKDVDKMVFDFDLNVPFKPFEQLMGVMPELSCSLLPIPYRDLMTNSESPIKDFYPSTFDQDQNGKKAEWEAIVKIPFIDAQRLLKAMGPKEKLLTEDENQRNSFGNSYQFSYDPSIMTVYPSSLPGFFPDLVNSHCKIEVFNLPTLGGLRFVKGLCEGALLGKDALPGFPSLYTLPIHPRIAFHAVNIFQTDSRNESVIVSIDDPYHGQAVEQVAAACLGKQVFAGWPFLIEAKVVAVSDGERRLTLNHSGAIVPMSHSPDRADKWRKAAHRIEHVYSKRFGVILDGVEIVLHVQLLQGLRRTDEGALEKEWDPEELEQAVQTVVMDRVQQDARYMERPARPVEEEYPIGEKVFFLGDKFFGCPATIYGYQDQKLTIQVAYFTTDAKELEAFAHRSANRDKALYYPSPIVCKQLRISPLTLSKICSGLMIDPPSGNRMNIGLNLKFEARSQKVLGYAQRNERGWEYSQKAIDLMKEYITAFPEITATLDRQNGKDVTRASEFFPDQTEKRVDELKKWIKAKGVRDFEKVSLYSDQMETEEVQKMEAFQDHIYSQKTMDHLKQAVLKGIPRRLLLKPGHAAHRLQHQEFSVGDRVITVSETGSVPLAVKGVVVGIQGGFIDVLFDIPFMGGTTLGGRCSPYRGMSLSPSSVINLSRPQVMQNKAPHPQRPVHMAHSTGATIGHHASATAHPSYRGVAHRGQAPLPSRGGRGGRGGHVDILRRGDMTGRYDAAARGQDGAYQPAPSAQSTMLSALTGGQSLNGQQGERNGPATVQRQNYNSVPPPAVLTRQDPPNRGRGRGGLGFNDRGRGRGGPFRGQGHAMGQTNGNDRATVATNGHGAEDSSRGALRGGRGGRGRGSAARGQSAGKAGGPAAPGPAPAPVL